MKHLQLLAVLFISVLIRVQTIHAYAHEQNGIASAYAEIAANLRDGRGYVYNDAPVSSYYLPGYALLNLLPVYGVHLVVDGILAPLSLFYALKPINARSAHIAAGLYAVALPVAYGTAWRLPDALTTALCTLIICAVLIGHHTQRIGIGAAVAGTLIGAAGWLRGDYILLLPLLAGVLLLHRHYRAALSMVAMWAVPAFALSAFLFGVYGTFNITRPGVGLLLWQGIGQAPNEWGIQPTDEAAQDVLASRQMRYGTAEGDNYLLREYMSHLAESPAVVIGSALHRFRRVVLASPVAWEWNYPGMSHVLRYAIDQLAMPLLLIGTAFGVYRARRNTFVLCVLAALWLSRVVPFTLMRDESRFILPLLTVYIIGTALAFGKWGNGAIMRR
jgi:hypothetical protein